MNQKVTCFFLLIFCLLFSSVNNVEARSLKMADPYIKNTEQ